MIISVEKANENVEVCELCGKPAEMNFNYQLPDGYEFDGGGRWFRADICLNCWRNFESDADVVLAVTQKRVVKNAKATPE